MSVKELSVNDLPTYPQAQLTGELGVVRVGGRWERNGQQMIGPLSRLILDHQPDEAYWVQAAMSVTGWSVLRVFAFQSVLGLNGWHTRGGISHDAQKGLTDATLYHLLFKLARRAHNGHA